jgi:hypothetical protein
MSLQKGFFLTNSYNPDLPPDEWTLVYENHTPGSYSESFGWGRYKVELSGAGGSGGASSSAHSSSYNYANNGASGKLFTAIVEVFYDETKTISGVIGSGGKSSTARGYDFQTGSYSVGAAGTGATNGVRGAGEVKNYTRPGDPTSSSAAAGGSGGGSTSAVGIGTAAGGAGGDCRARNSGNQNANGTGGAGGSGSNQGNGASGGAGKYAYDALATSGAGSNGWVKIYKSNVYPE